MDTASVSVCQSECSAQELVAFAFPEPGKGGFDVLGCCFLLKSLLQVKTCALGQINCCEKVTHCGLWAVEGVVRSWMLRDNLEFLLLFLYLFLQWKSRSGL